MLVRCEHCGSVLPEEAAKCCVCGNKHKKFTPSPESLKEIEILRKKFQRADKIFTKISCCVLLMECVLFFTSIIAWFIAAENIEVANASLIGLSGSIVLFFLTLLFDFKVGVPYDRKLKAKEKAVFQKTKPSEDEYERMIRDFINQ